MHRRASAPAPPTTRRRDETAPPLHRRHHVDRSRPERSRRSRPSVRARLVLSIFGDALGVVVEATWTRFRRSGPRGGRRPRPTGARVRGGGRPDGGGGGGAWRGAGGAATGSPRARVRVRILVAIVGDVSRAPVAVRVQSNEAIEGTGRRRRGVENRRHAARARTARARRAVAGKPPEVRETVRVGGGDGSCRRAMVRAAFAGGTSGASRRFLAANARTSRMRGGTAGTKAGRGRKRSTAFGSRRAASGTGGRMVSRLARGRQSPGRGARGPHGDAEGLGGAATVRRARSPTDASRWNAKSRRWSGARSGSGEDGRGSAASPTGDPGAPWASATCPRAGPRRG